MKSLLNDILDYVDTNSIKWKAGKNFFGGREPADPSNTLTVFNAPGRGRFLPMRKDTDITYEYSAFQLRIRSLDYLEAENDMLALIDLLHGLSNVTINGHAYTLIESLDSPFLLEWDDQNRAKIVSNFSVQRTPDS